jgi:hypothetical protein
LAEDTPAGLIARLSGQQQLTLQIRADWETLRSGLQHFPGVDALEYLRSDQDLHTLLLKSCQSGIQESLARYVVEQGWGLRALQTATGTLEDVFIQLVTEEEGMN